MDKKKDIFYFSGTHWDREWYQSMRTVYYHALACIKTLSQ